MSEEALRRKLDRANGKVRVLEDLIENKTRELFQANEELAAALEYQRQIAAILPESLLVVTQEGAIRIANPSATQLLGGDLQGRAIGDVWSLDELARERVAFETSWRRLDGSELPVLVSVAALETGEACEYVCVATDLRERRALEIELRHAQKLKSVGQLAAGAAHEINTPMQFIGDNLEFLRESFDELLGLVAFLRARLPNAEDEEIAERIEDADLDFMQSRGPRAFQRANEGVARVTEIVAAMKAFSHPQTQRADVDLNGCIQSTLSVAKSEYKYVADVHVELGELPMIRCSGGDVRQVLLNLVVNAAHAIEDRNDGRGEIRIRSWLDGERVGVSVADTGTGVPEEIRARIFEPFFTTKEVGRGAGQGLALAYAVVVEGHGGTLTLDSEVGRGSTFTLRLPLRAA
ncbi:MAG: ATP-binding protein [Myxococcota bacterium]